MALNAATLGSALYEARQPFNDTPWQTLLDAYGNAEGIRRAIANADAAAIVAHITANAEVEPTELIAGDVSVTGTGKIV